MNTLIVIESLTIVNSLNKVQFPFVKVFPPQMLSSSSEGAIVQAVPIAFAPVVQKEKDLDLKKGKKFWAEGKKICSYAHAKESGSSLNSLS